MKSEACIPVERFKRHLGERIRFACPKLMVKLYADVFC